jgi:hypothetical protein
LGPWGRDRLNRAKVNVKQSLAFVTFVLILLPEPDYLLQDLYVEAIAFCLGKNVLFLVIHHPEIFIDPLDALYERAKPITGNPIWSTHGLLLSASQHLGEESRPGLPPNGALFEIGPDMQHGSGGGG